MGQVTSLLKINIPATPMQLEYSYKPNAEQLGSFESTMEFYLESGTVQNGVGFIEWDIPDLGRTECIGIWIENNELTDYDGLFCLPNEAINLLEQLGVVINEEFRD